MDIKTTTRVTAYIIRQNQQGMYELLMFERPDCSETPIQLPGGGVEPQETLEEALHREVLEESGLSSLTIIRKLGVAEVCWLQPRKLISYRHCFLMLASQPTADTWKHTVEGDGIDAGIEFSYFWCRPAVHFKLPDNLSYFLHPEWIPELYNAESDRPLAARLSHT